MTTAAPQQLHECLDLLYQAVVVGRNMGFGTQLILSVDKDGNLGDLKVSMNGKAINAVKGALLRDLEQYDKGFNDGVAR